MKYLEFEIKNFKGINHLIIETGNKINTLVGLNESGKTTILESIHWFYEPEIYEVYELLPNGERSNFTNEISVKSKIKLDENDESIINKYLIKNNGFYITEPISEIVVTRKYEFDSSELTDQKRLWEFSLKGRKGKRGKIIYSINSSTHKYGEIFDDCLKYLANLLPPIVYYENFLFDFPNKIYLETTNDKDNIYRSVIQDVMTSLDESMTIEKHLLEREKSEKKHTKRLIASTLDDIGAKITSIVMKAWSEILEPTKNGKDEVDIEITLGDKIEKDEVGYYIEIQVKEGRTRYTISQRSLGFRWFCGYALFTYFRTFRNAQTQNVQFLLDEPASNLHSSAQTKLLDEFDRIPKNSSLIYSTHSHYLINPKRLSGTYVVKNEGKSYKEGFDLNYKSDMTKIMAEKYYRFAAKHPNQEDYFRPILDALDVQPSLLDHIPEVIFLEGRNDYYTFRYIRDQYFPDSEIDKFLFPGAGKDKFSTIVALYLGWGRNFLVLLDDDDGKKTAKRLKKEFGPALENKVFTLRDINESWENYATEDLFLHNDPMRIIAELDPSVQQYEKGWFNKAIEKCWINNIDIDLTKSTLGNFDKLFKFLGKTLESNRTI